MSYKIGSKEEQDEYVEVFMESIKKELLELNSRLELMAMEEMVYDLYPLNNTMSQETPRDFIIRWLQIKDEKDTENNNS